MIVLALLCGSFESRDLQADMTRNVSDEIMIEFDLYVGLI
jgi:hypothetical protein